MPPLRRIARRRRRRAVRGADGDRLLDGFSPNRADALLETLAVIGFAAGVVFGGAIMIGLRLAD